MKINSSQYNNLWRGLALTMILACITLGLFFATPLKSPNEIYFSSNGDGLQCYYATAYHLKHDTNYFHQRSINYPYGENVLLTGCQPNISNIIKLIKPIINLENNAVAITNLLMLFSIIFSAIFIFLILYHFQTNWVFAAITATAISFLSPQMNRLTGHFTLAAHYAIPMFIYLLLKFYEKPSWLLSIIICLTLTWLAMGHLYFYGFFIAIAIPVYALIVIEKRISQKLVAQTAHLLLQLVIPFLIVRLIGAIGEHPNDRTHLPWGFLVHKSRMSGVFFPYGLPYEGFVRKFWIPKSTAWEGLAYIGIIGIAGVIYIGTTITKNFLAKKISLAITHSSFLNVLFWTSIVLLMYSFGLPFILGMKGLVKRLPFITQMRGIGRFSWFFFYVINIISVIAINSLLKSKKTLKFGIFALVSATLCFDAFYTTKNISEALIHRIPDLADTNNMIESNSWIKQVDLKKYQAILPLPYFNVGSENIWINPKGDIIKNSFIVSLKTGLPLMATLSSRTSISETFKHIDPLLDVPENFNILADIKDPRPVLIIADLKHMNTNERFILNLASPLFKTNNYDVYSLNLQELYKIKPQKKEVVVDEIAHNKLFSSGGFLSTDSMNRFVYLDYNNSNISADFNNSGVLSGTAKHHLTIFKNSLPATWTDSVCNFSFWFRDFKTDIYPRSFIEITSYLKNDTNTVVGYEYYDTFELLKQLKGNWALLEGRFSIKPNIGIVKIDISNADLPNSSPFLIDEFFLKPISVTLYKSKEQYLFKNNRYY